MKPLFFLFSGLFLLTIASFTHIDIDKRKCLILHQGTFLYSGADEVHKVVIKGKSHTEYHNDGKYMIKSKLEWLSPCEFNMTVKKVTVPDFPFETGAVMNVKVNRVSGNEIFYTSTIEAKSWEGKMIKVK